jgi:hypothetical protein
MHIGRIIRTGADLALDAASDYAIAEGEKKLRELGEHGRENLVISAALNGAMLTSTAVTAFFIYSLYGAGLFAAALINYVILGRALLNFVRLVRTVLIPYRRLIIYVLPVFWSGRQKYKSFNSTIQEAIRAAVRFYYNDKVPETAQTIHDFASAFGLVKNRAELEDKAATDFYPLVCRFLRVALVYNVLLFGICYGALVFIIKRFMFNAMLGMRLWDLFAYPFTFFFK